MESNDSPGIPDRGEKSDIPDLPSGGKGEDKADRGRGGKTTSGNGQAWSSAGPRGQWRTGGNGKKTGCERIGGAPTTLEIEV